MKYEPKSYMTNTSDNSRHLEVIEYRFLRKSRKRTFTSINNEDWVDERGEKVKHQYLLDKLSCEFERTAKAVFRYNYDYYQNGAH